MHTQKRFTAKLAGMVLASVMAVATLVSCASAEAADYTILSNVDKLSCATVDANEAPRKAESLRKLSLKIGENSTVGEQQSILRNNPGMKNISDLTTALDAKAVELDACTTSDGSPTEPGDTESPILSDELKKLLDASNAPMIDCVAIVKESGGTVVDNTYALFVKALLGVDAKDPNLRKWSDALSTPLKGADKDEMQKWLNRAICEEPIIGVSLAHLFADLKVKDTSILALQTTDWLKPYAVNADEIDTLVAKFVPLEQWKLQNPGDSADEELYGKALKANHEYRKLASKLIFLLSRYELAGVRSIDSTHHYHLVAGGLRADGIPEVGIDTSKDSLPSLVFELTEKTGCKPISVLGFNLGDKRPMLGNIPVSCEKPTKKPADEPTKKPRPEPTNKPTPEPTDKPTDRPTDKPTDKPTPPPPSCPPGQVEDDKGDCLKLKDDDKDDYDHPTDKPGLPPATSPPDSKPKPVPTEEPGGRDTTDSPTKKPGDESGVSAPGATPAPTSKPSIPPNEGGDNDSTVDPGGF